MSKKVEYFIVGKRAVFESLRANYPVKRIILQEKGKYDETISNILALARRKGIEILARNELWFDRRFKTLNPQGIVGIGEPFQYSSLDELEVESNSIFLILDRIQDPQNLGAIIRTAECGGVAGVIIQERESAEVTESVVSISSGAVFHVKVVRVKNLAYAVRYLKERGVWVIGTSSESERAYYHVDYKRHPFAVILGNEGEGIRQGLLKECDYIVSIPMRGLVNSLNVSVAAGIVLFKMLEEKGANGEYD